MKIKHYLSCLVLLLCFSAVELTAQTVKRGPYLQMSTPTTIIIRWRTDVSTQSKVWYGTSPENLSQTATANGNTKEHEVLVDGLNSATVYYYRVGDNSGPYPELHGSQYFKTHPAGNETDEPIRVWMLGNAGTKTNEQREVRDAYYAVVNEEHIDMMLLTGDNAYDDGKDSEYQDAWFEDMYEARLVNSVMWSCFGNHDGGDADSDDESGAYYEIFNFPRNGEAGGVSSGTEAYYSFDYGNMHVISLNTHDVDREPGDDMINWLEDDLAANQKKWQVVILHHRPYTGSNDNDSDDDEKPTDVRKYMLPRLEAAGVDLVLASHSHNYQRSFLINGHYGKSNTFDEDEMGVDMGDGQADGDGVYSKVNSDIGTVYVVAGTAGQDDGGADELNHPVMYYNSGSAGSVQLLVSDTELVFQFINEDEEIEDYFTIEKAPTFPVSNFKISNPTEGSVFTPQQNVTITADATGSLLDVDHVDFYVNNAYIGSDNSSPFNQLWIVPAVGEFEIKAVAHEQSGNDTEETIVNVVSGSSQICVAISSSEDDAEERASGSVSLTSRDLELAEDNGIQHVGLRFQNLGLPSGVTIDSAFIQFVVDETDNVNPCLLQIYGEKSLNTVSYDDDDLNISSRSKTNTHVSWSPANWNFVNESTNAQRTPNIASVIQEVIDQPEYNNQQTLAFIISGTGTRVAESFNGGPEKAPVLCIYYSPDSPCVDVDEDGICDDNDPCTTGPNVGTPCNDNNNGTYNDVIDTNCNCVGTPYDCPTLLADIGSPCNDGNPNTSNDFIDENCNCTGSSFDCPTLGANIGDACDDGNPNTVNDFIINNCLCIGSPVQVETVMVQVSNGSDDAEQEGDGEVSLGSSDLELVLEDENQIVGIRFLNTGIPPGSFIANAYIQFTADETDVIDPCILTITGEASDQPQTFVDEEFNISSRPRTLATATWQPPSWGSEGDDGAAQRTANLANIVQELVNRSGYNVSTPLAFIIEGQGKRVADSYDGSAATAPKLFVSYSSNCEDDDNDGICNGQDLCDNSPEPGTPCNDNNSNTYDDVIDSNCNCTGITFDCPSLSANIGDSCDDGNSLTFNDAIDGDCACVGVEVGTEQTVCSQISTAEDDAEERSDGSLKINSGDLEFVLDASSQIIGLRFLNLNIPQGAVIQEAAIQFMVDEKTNIDPCNLSVFAEASDNPAGFVDEDHNISSRARTNVAVSWSPPLWNIKGAAGPGEKTVDISPVLQEVVNQPAFSENSPVVIMIDGIGKRVAEAYEGGADRAPELCVTYSASIPPLGMVAIDNGDVIVQANKVAADEGAGKREELKSITAVVDLKVYPNPAKDQLNLVFYSLLETEMQIQIQNVNGQLLRVQTYATTKGNNHIRIADLNLPNGVYIVKMKEGKMWQSRKFTILK